MIVRVKWLTFQTSELKVSVAKLRLLLTCVFVIIPLFQLYQNGTCESLAEHLKHIQGVG